ncbi:serine hydroxymethyltransferase [candidate division WWE3 bacterium CG10_big_fil_rev_8_21_14_0_10_32_10]|uniref:Serine hydroxymethyltransferase n=1 Tax=candidate division WWE3 bacterium CG10_big_fil_rev_8_21_14_0_10_32_10 TaxID=1975090 RepID=A0A2H0RAH2_UNCKA|nr:MAG: serine hydroxymethyltransferase [candidate division WWE3 bacterium CG10_big_fil_rev_8_21_14_0_10_32_10]
MKIKKSHDSLIYSLIKKEEKRQKEEFQMIPSENYASSDVLNPLASVLSNKYSEGYPGRRYYQGNKYIDEIENLAITRAKKLFKAEYVNIQPLSGTPANLAAYMALLKPGDKILSMNLASGGHLSHGSPVNMTSKNYNIVFYNVDEKSGMLDYDAIHKLAKKEKPNLVLAGASAYSREIDFKKFSEIAKSVGAFFMADIAHIAGLVATGLHNSPIPYADIVTTTTHKTLRGPRGGLIMAKEQYAKEIAKAVFPGGVQAGPHNNVHAAKAVCFYEALQPEFKKYSKQVIKNAKTLSNEFIKMGYKVVSGGTDNHLMLLDLRNKNIDGKTVAEALDSAGIVVNYNMIPYDPGTPFRPSGIRLGTPALTSRGMVEKDMVTVAEFINRVIDKYDNAFEHKKIRLEVKEFASKFKVPGLDD